MVFIGFADSACFGPSFTVSQSQSKAASWKCPGEADTDGDNCISEEESVLKIAWMSIPVG